MGNKKSCHKSFEELYTVTLPPYTKGWDLLYSGDIEHWAPVADDYGLGEFAYGCKESDCDRDSICVQYIHASHHKWKRINICRFDRQVTAIPCSDSVDLKSLIEKKFVLNSLASAWRNNYLLLVLHYVQDFVTDVAFLVIDLDRKLLVTVLKAPRKCMTVIFCDFTPDLIYTAVLFYSFSKELHTFCYDLYLYSNQSAEIVKQITLNHEVQPYIAFDPRHQWTKLAVANFESRAVGIHHELVVISLDSQAVVKRSKLVLPILFGSSRFNLLYSKDGSLLFLLKLTDNHFGVTTFCDIYIFNSDEMILIKYITSTLPGLFHICKVNYQPVFSKCGSYMRILDHKVNGPERNGVPLSVQIFQLPRFLSLQAQCRISILQHIQKAVNICHLPLPPKMKHYLLFRPLYP